MPVPPDPDTSMLGSGVGSAAKVAIGVLVGIDVLVGKTVPDNVGFGKTTGKLRLHEVKNKSSFSFAVLWSLTDAA
jgi:hypothetical protein